MSRGVMVAGDLAIAAALAGAALYVRNDQRGLVAGTAATLERAMRTPSHANWIYVAYVSAGSVWAKRACG